MKEEVITREALTDLLEYSVTVPTGVVIGKRWRSASMPSRFNADETEWYIRTYVAHPTDPNLAEIHTVWAVSKPGVPHRGRLRPGKL